MDSRASIGHDLNSCFNSQTVPAIAVVTPASEKQEKYENNQNG
jgi:hypothetical protein